MTRLPLDPVSPGDHGIPTEGMTESKTVTSSVTNDANRPWMSRHLRNIIALLLTLTVVYLAVIVRDQSAIATVVASFAILAGAIWGARDALKIPGRDN